MEKAKKILEMATELSYYNSKLFEKNLKNQDFVKSNCGIEVNIKKHRFFISQDLAKQINARDKLKELKKYIKFFCIDNEKYADKKDVFGRGKKILEFISITEKIYQNKLDNTNFDEKVAECAEIIENNVKFDFLPTLFSFKFGVGDIREFEPDELNKLNEVIAFYAQYEELDK